MSCLVFAQDPGMQKVQAVNTQHLDFPAGGVLHLKNSFGELAVEGWDRPEVEVTTTRITQYFYDSENSEKGMRELDRVRVTTERHGDEVLVSTVFPKKRSFPMLSLHLAVSVDLESRIKVPYGARLVVEHGTGEVDVQNITGEIRATVRRGRIAVGLPEEGKYEIDAKSYLGGVVSDFLGHAKPSRRLLGTQFMDTGAPGGARKVYLRVGYGDILIRKVSRIAVPAPMQ